MGEDKKQKFSAEEMEIKIDYENIDVEEIMNQIKRKIASRPAQEIEQQEEETRNDYREIIPPPLTSPPGGLRSKIRRILLKLMRPFAPLIKLMILPVDEELRETVENLDYANRRLDELTERLHQEANRIGRLESKIDLNHQLVNEKIDLNHQLVNERLELAFKDLGRAKEYTKLLHQLTHNLVVEMTKLKIEKDHLKIQSRILEKDLAFLNRREKEVEKKVFS